MRKHQKAYEYLNNHSKSVDVHEKHPLLDLNEYEFEGWTVQGKGDKRFGAHKGKPRDTAYDFAVATRAVASWWDGQFINNLNFGYFDSGRIWLETGPAMWESHVNQYIGNTHDTRLDVAAKTFERALVKLAKRVKRYYPEDK